MGFEKASAEVLDFGFYIIFVLFCLFGFVWGRALLYFLQAGMVLDVKKFLIETNPIGLSSLLHPSEHIIHIGTYASAKPKYQNKQTEHFTL